MSDFMLFSILFAAIPAVLFALFAVSLYRYLSARKQDRLAPGTISPKELTARKIMLIVTSVVLGVFVAVVIGFMALMAMAIVFM